MLKIFIISKPQNTFDAQRLLTTYKVLNVYFCYHNIEKIPKQDAVKLGSQHVTFGQKQGYQQVKNYNHKT